MAEGEQGGGLPDAARTEARAGPELGAEIERRAKHRDIRLDGVPVRLVGILAEGADADERKVEAARFVSVR